MKWFKRKYTQIQRVLYFLPIIWKGYDWDYSYAIELFRHQLQRTATFLEGENSYILNHQFTADRIKTAIKLMDRVYDEEYYMHEHQTKLKNIYGDDVFDFEFKDTFKGDGSTYLKYKYENWENADEIRELNHKYFHESTRKQKKAHRILWRYIEHNIQNWWD